MDMIQVLVNREFARREGVDDTRALTLGMVGAMIGPGVTGYVVTMALAKREAPQPVVVTTDGGDGKPPVPAAGASAPADAAASATTDAGATAPPAAGVSAPPGPGVPAPADALRRPASSKAHTPRGD